MIIGFDAKRAFANHTGLGNYSRYIINNLSDYYPSGQYFLYAPEKRENAAVNRFRDKDNIRFVFPTGLHACFSSLWRTKGITADLVRDRVQLYHGLSNELPVGLQKKGIHSVVTVHDLIFLRYPQFYKAPDRAIYTRKFRYACRHADRIVAVSECTKQDIVSFFGVSPDRISVIYQGCDASFSQAIPGEEIERVSQKYRLPRNFILNVGTVEARKNLMLAVKALPLLDKSVHLVAVGKETPYAEEIRKYAAAHHLESRIHIITGVPLSDLPAIYRSASVFVYPSFFEGFGIPVVEALQSDIPVIAATGSCLKEAGGPGSVYVDPDNEQQLAEAIQKVLSDAGLREKMIAEGKQYATRFHDRLLTDRLMELYQRLVNNE
jgi:glycosyltransferase involved in cell wall biosynthesis